MARFTEPEGDLVLEGFLRVKEAEAAEFAKLSGAKGLFFQHLSAERHNVFWVERAKGEACFHSVLLEGCQR